MVPDTMTGSQRDAQKRRRKKKYIQVQVRIIEQEMCAMLLMNYKKCYQIYTITDYLQPEAHTRPFITVCDSSGYIYQR